MDFRFEFTRAGTSMGTTAVAFYAFTYVKDSIGYLPFFLALIAISLFIFIICCVTGIKITSMVCCVIYDIFWITIILLIICFKLYYVHKDDLIKHFNQSLNDYGGQL
ncbi:hypothetical protein I4U23_010482 [Adineta vaga]|nr:hypothetical protein I4U23_010482 [Adineta vaga]